MNYNPVIPRVVEKKKIIPKTKLFWSYLMSIKLQNYSK